LASARVSASSGGRVRAVAKATVYNHKHGIKKLLAA